MPPGRPVTFRTRIEVRTAMAPHPTLRDADAIVVGAWVAVGTIWVLDGIFTWSVLSNKCAPPRPAWQRRRRARPKVQRDSEHSL